MVTKRISGALKLTDALDHKDYDDFQGVQVKPALSTFKNTCHELTQGNPSTWIMFYTSNRPFSEYRAYLKAHAVVAEPEKYPFPVAKTAFKARTSQWTMPPLEGKSSMFSFL